MKFVRELIKLYKLVTESLTFLLPGLLALSLESDGAKGSAQLSPWRGWAVMMCLFPVIYYLNLKSKLDHLTSLSWTKFITYNFIKNPKNINHYESTRRQYFPENHVEFMGAWHFGHLSPVLGWAGTNLRFPLRTKGPMPHSVEGGVWEERCFA